jgi:hypothetical protein
MFQTGTKKNGQIFFYLLLFLSSFLIFDFQTIVVVVLFAVFALKYFLTRAEDKNNL